MKMLQWYNMDNSNCINDTVDELILQDTERQAKLNERMDGNLKEALDKDYLQQIMDYVYLTAEKDALSYLSNTTPENAVSQIILWAKVQTASTGFASGLTGFITSLALLGPEILFCSYKNLKMIAMIARLRGYDLNQDRVQILIKATLLGMSVTAILKEVGEKAGIASLKHLTKPIIQKIHKMLGVKFLAKFGTKGAMNFLTMVPLVGGVIGGTLNTIETSAIASFALTQFP